MGRGVHEEIGGSRKSAVNGKQDQNSGQKMMRRIAFIGKSKLASKPNLTMGFHVALPTAAVILIMQGGGNDNGVWLEFSFPLWKLAPQKTEQLAMERRIRKLEQALDLQNTLCQLEK